MRHPGIVRVHHRVLLIIVLFSFTITGKTQSVNEDFFKNGIVSISGQIVNMRHGDSKFLFLSRTDLLSGKSEVMSLSVDSLGNFEKIVPVFNSQELNLQYQDRNIRLLVKPSDNLNLIIDAIDPEKETQISGIGGVRNLLFLKYNKLSGKITNDYHQGIEKIQNKELALIALTTKCNKVHLKLDSLNDSFIAKNKPDELLTKWMLAENKLLCCYELMEYAMLNHMSILKIMKNEGGIRESDINNKDLYCNEFYTSVVFKYYSHPLFNENKILLSKFITYLKNDHFKEALGILADSIYNEYQGIAKDIVLYQSLRLFSEDDFIKMIGRQPDVEKWKKYLVQHLQSDFVTIRVLDYAKNDENSKIENTAGLPPDDILAELIQKHKGKVLYIDISATWCSPCMSELPNSIMLHENLSNKAVEFIYLFAKSGKGDWEKMSRNIGLRGENIFLTNEQYNLLLSKYKIDTGFPQFLVIKKNGELVTKTAKRPSDSGLKDDILKLIEN